MALLTAASFLLLEWKMAFRPSSNFDSASAVTEQIRITCDFVILARGSWQRNSVKKQDL